MYDELIESLRYEAAFAYLGSDGERLAGMMRKAADAIEDLEFACNRYEKDYKALCEYLPKWIPVTERLPKEEETVLAFGTLGVAWLDWRHDNKWCCYGGVTHWMPLPEPPKEK